MIWSQTITGQSILRKTNQRSENKIALFPNLVVTQKYITPLYLMKDRLIKLPVSARHHLLACISKRPKT